MTIKVLVQGNSGHTANVTTNGEFVISPSFAQATKVTLVSDNTPLNLVKAIANEKLIITGLIINTNRDVGVNGALIEVYEASNSTTATVDKPILSFDMIKNQTVVTSPLLFETTAGKYINAKADDSAVNVTILGYFVPSEKAATIF